MCTFYQVRVLSTVSSTPMVTPRSVTQLICSIGESYLKAKKKTTHKNDHD